MKKTAAIILACVLCVALAAPAFAYNYEFTTGEDTLPGFGKSTSNDDPVPPDPMTENTRRNKDAALLPPPYGVFSGDIPTDPSSLYHDNTPKNAGNGYNATGTIPGYNSYEDYPGATTNTSTPPTAPGLEASTSIVASNIEPQYYENGSIGTIYVARTGKTITVYEGESLDNLKKGAGHFTSTSSWDGNVALCGHNRGSSPYFSFVKDLQTGDKITYTTRYGTRTYEVFSKEQIGEYDYSKLGRSAENLLTLITCIENTPELRWSAQLREVG
ncbi:MAG: sortase [Oscillospiraceae bacterium]|nr:sortase [Oscillospiraceae bacterium]